jgi:hypothetical protein
VTYYQQVALRRWPRRKLKGDGPYAIYLGCCNTVELVATPLQACAIGGKRCCPDCVALIAPDQNWHQVHQLPEPPHARALRYSPAEIER